MCQRRQFCIQCSMESQLKDIPQKYQALFMELLTENNALKNQVNFLEEQIQLFVRRKFGSSADKIPFGCQLLFNETEELAEDKEEPGDPSPVKPHNRAKPKRKPLPVELPRIEKIYELKPEELVCAADGSQLVKIGEEVSEQLDIIPVFRGSNISTGSIILKSRAES